MWPVFVGGATLLGVSVTLGVLWIGVTPRPAAVANRRSGVTATSRPELATIVAAVGRSRPIEGRLTGGFLYGPWQSALARRASAGSAPLTLRSVRARAEMDALTRNTPANDAALAVALVTSGAPGPAIDLLENALAETPRQRAWWADLAAARIARAELEDAPYDVAQAVEYAGRALHEDGPIEARFNLALGLERLGLEQQALFAWREYLQHDTASPWAGEARQHAERLARQLQAKTSATPRADIEAHLAGDRTSGDRAAGDHTAGGRAALEASVRAHPQVAREYLEDDLLSRWGVNWQAGDQSASDTLLTQILDLSTMLAAATGDDMAPATARALEQARRDGDDARLTAMARGFVAYGDGRRRYDAEQIAEATAQFDAAAADLRRSDSPLAGWAVLHQAVMAYRASTLDASDRHVEDAIAFSVRYKAPTLRARAEWMRAFLHLVRGEYEDALRLYRAAAVHFDRTRETENAATVHIQIADTLDALGDVEGAWRERAIALRQLAPHFSHRRRNAVLMLASRSALANGLPHLALRIQADVVANAEAWGAANQLSQAYYTRARINARLQRDGAAREDLVLTRAAVARISVPALARASEAELRLSEAEVLSRLEPRRAIDTLDVALAWFRSTGVAFRDEMLFLTRGRAHLAAGDLASAERDFLAGIESFERQLAALTSSDTRVSAFDQRWELFGEMLRLYAARGQDASGNALVFAERGRARELHAGAGADSVGALLRDWPADAAAVFYSFLDDRLLIWTITRAGVTVKERGGAPRLHRLAARYATLLTRGDAPDATRTASAELYEALLGPVDKILATYRAIVIVPDGVLHRVPFATLLDRASGKYFVERHAVVVSPSLRTFIRQSARLSALPRSPGRALVIGNPAFDRASNPGLPALPASEREADTIARLYPHSTLLLRDDATKARLLAEVQRADVLHFGGHAIVNEAFPKLSRLLTASGAGTGMGGAVYGYELEAVPLGRLRLAVLAACGTASGRMTRGEGPLSLGRALIAAGVPAVVSTLWEVRDDTARPLVEALHAGIRDGLDAPSALRAAQLQLIRGSEPGLRAPSAWGSFIATAGIDTSAQR